jgi:hypothetical protein
MQRKPIFAFPLQRWLCGRATVFRYTYGAYLFYKLESYSLKFEQKNSLFSPLTPLPFLLPFSPSYTLNILSFCPCCHYYSFHPLFRLFDVTIFISRSKYSVIASTGGRCVWLTTYHTCSTERQENPGS